MDRLYVRNYFVVAAGVKILAVSENIADVEDVASPEVHSPARPSIEIRKIGQPGPVRPGHPVTGEDDGEVPKRDRGCIHRRDVARERSTD